MDTKLKEELKAHIVDAINDRMNNDVDYEDQLHYVAFNEDYYIIGYYQAEQWLLKHNISPFEAIAEVIEWENDNFGEVQLKGEDINSEKIVNLYTYIKGEELLSEVDLTLEKAELIEAIEAL